MARSFLCTNGTRNNFLARPNEERNNQTKLHQKRQLEITHGCQNTNERTQCPKQALTSIASTTSDGYKKHVRNCCT